MNRRRVEVQTEQADSCPSIVRSVGRVLKEAMLFGGAAAVGTIALSALPWAQDGDEGAFGSFLGSAAACFLSAIVPSERVVMEERNLEEDPSFQDQVRAFQDAARRREEEQRQDLDPAHLRNEARARMDLALIRDENRGG